MAVVVVVLAAFTLGAGSGTSEAATSGDVVYYADAPFGTIYCAAANSSVDTYVSGQPASVVRTTTIAKALVGVFCASLDPRSSGQVNSRTGLLNSSQQLCVVSSWEANGGGSATSNVTRYWDTQGSGMPSSCRGTQNFYVIGATHVAANLDWRDYLHIVGPEVGG